jgi:hypothetical protein
MRITPAMIQALTTLRKSTDPVALKRATDVLDNAGVFAEIDEATGYEVGGYFDLTTGRIIEL